MNPRVRHDEIDRIDSARRQARCGGGEHIREAIVFDVERRARCRIVVVVELAVDEVVDRVDFDRIARAGDQRDVLVGDAQAIQQEGEGVIETN